MSDEKLQQGHKITTVNSSTIPSINSGILCMNMINQDNAVLKIHTEPKDIILDQEVVSPKVCSTFTNTDKSLTSSKFKVSVNGNPVHEKISDMLSISTPVTGILSPVACSMIDVQTTQNLYYEFPRTITAISSIPTDLMLVFCIPHNIMSLYVQPRIDYELQFNIFNARNILRSTTFMYGPNVVNVLPKIEHSKYSMKICYNDKHLSPSIDVFKITTGTQVTQSFQLKSVEKVSVRKLQNVNGINLYNPYDLIHNLNNDVMITTDIREKNQTSTNNQTN
ncbi:uncharacterized protein LOC113558828 [Rhopalosiphum maidis]|uniref:uncharacterized protein LOC113558828 n=1 Tax=Rhopalosiphum maidis TaxID=43146 RepID=UPI000EFEA168|nr:uncharacterized protein LOC113558828 [Rhopalosiphum maidis]